MEHDLGKPNGSEDNSIRKTSDKENGGNRNRLRSK